MIAGVVKYFRFPLEDVLYNISYTNIVMLSAAIPDWSQDSGDTTLDASDPSNNAMIMRALGV